MSGLQRYLIIPQNNIQYSTNKKCKGENEPCYVQGYFDPLLFYYHKEVGNTRDKQGYCHYADYYLDGVQLPGPCKHQKACCAVISSQKTYYERFRGLYRKS